MSPNLLSHVSSTVWTHSQEFLSVLAKVDMAQLDEFWTGSQNTCNLSSQRLTNLGGVLNHEAKTMKEMLRKFIKIYNWG